MESFLFWKCLSSVHWFPLTGKSICTERIYQVLVCRQWGTGVSLDVSSFPSCWVFLAHLSLSDWRKASCLRGLYALTAHCHCPFSLSLSDAHCPVQRNHASHFERQRKKEIPETEWGQRSQLSSFTSKRLLSEAALSWSPINTALHSEQNMSESSRELTLVTFYR